MLREDLLAERDKLIEKVKRQGNDYRYGSGDLMRIAEIEEELCGI